MNKRSLKAGVHMARRTDPSKIEKIRKAAMDLIVERGYGGASIGDIAKKAGVSSGYLYRHYSSKRELVDDLIESNIYRLYGIFGSLVEKHMTVKDIIDEYVRAVFNIAIDRPILAKFISVIVFDPKFRIERKNDEDGHINRSFTDFIKKIIEIGSETGEVSPKISPRDVLIVILTIPFSHISFSFSLGPNEEDFTKKRAQEIVEICLNALK